MGSFLAIVVGLFAGVFLLFMVFVAAKRAQQNYFSNDVVSIVQDKLTQPILNSINNREFFGF